jgi:putative effector of murein hydrolase LrgA (UPF0299 family)
VSATLRWLARLLTLIFVPAAVALLRSIWVQFVPYFLVGVGEVFTK